MKATLFLIAILFITNAQAASMSILIDREMIYNFTLISKDSKYKVQVAENSPVVITTPQGVSEVKGIDPRADEGDVYNPNYKEPKPLVSEAGCPMIQLSNGFFIEECSTKKNMPAWYLKMGTKRIPLSLEVKAKLYISTPQG